VTNFPTGHGLVTVFTNGIPSESVIIKVEDPGVPPSHPADTNTDWRMTINEVTAYGAAWKLGNPWPTPPSPIDIDFVTNAGSLWILSEMYHYDGSKNPPLCWATGASAAPSVTAAGLRAAWPSDEEAGGRNSRAVASLEALSDTRPAVSQVDILILPGGGVQVYAVEEIVPAGWIVLGASDDGVYDVASGKLRWGPFFDGANRRLTFAVAPSAQSSRMPVVFTGLASFDGVSILVDHGSRRRR
jgi:hypothetical protein